MIDELGTLLSKSIQYFSQVEGVVAIAIVGSIARNEADEWSDIDLVIIVEDDYKDDIMNGEWAESVGNKTLSFKQFGYEVRVLYEDFYDFDYIFFTRSQLEGDSLDPELKQMLSNGFEIAYDSNNVLVNIEIEDVDASKQDFGELSDDIWFHIIWAAKKICRGELWYAYYWTNRGLQDQFLQAVRSDVRNPVRRLRFVDDEVDKTMLAKITDTFTEYNPLAIINGLRECMSTYWHIQQSLHADISEDKLRSYKRVQDTVERILTKAEAQYKGQ